MGRRPEQTLFQIGPEDGQQAQKKMLNTAGHQGVINQNHNKIPPHACQNGYHQKDKKQ